MTTKPKAKKFRIRRSTSLASDLNRDAPDSAAARPQRPARPEPAQPAWTLVARSMMVSAKSHFRQRQPRR